jgi:Xaa-Pro aminopeptidase
VGVAWAGFLALCAAATAGTSDYHARREQFAKAAPAGVVVLIGQPERDSDDVRTGFFQEPNFYYLTGWKQPGAILLIDGSRETLFLPGHDRERERWTGPRVAADDPDVRQVTGFDTVLPAEQFETELRASLERRSKIYTIGESAIARLRALAPMREVMDARLTLARMRMKKSPGEIELLQRAADATIAAHRAAWKRAAPGIYEYQVAATVMSAYFDRGCERNAYPPIVGSGPNSVFLHYQRNQRRMDHGDLLLIDAGGECSGYAADVTRTIPVGGRFTKRQREIYEVVLGAQKAAIAAVKPGQTIATRSPNGLYQIAYDYINTHGKDLHGDPLGKYFIHGISHHIGLEVHDVNDPAIPLDEGMVISIEPGIYIPEENIGIRIEDMVLVTKDGARVMTAALPREPSEIEKALAP